MTGSVSSVLHELAEPLSLFRTIDDFFPLAFVGVDDVLHHGLQLATNTELVVNDHFFDVIDTAFKFLHPDGCPGQLVGGHAVVHQESVDVLDRGLGVDVCGHQITVARFRTAVPATDKGCSPGPLRPDQSLCFVLRRIRGHIPRRPT